MREGRERSARSGPEQELCYGRKPGYEGSEEEEVLVVFPTYVGLV